MFDKFREECGVVAIFGHPEASKMAYLGLYSLQHRGQESAGICTATSGHIHCHKAMGHVADIFTSSVLATLPGRSAIGHTRYSTTGDTVLLNAQPFSVSCNKGRLAVAHNGNITNAAELREELGRRGSIFQASSDTEVVLHLVAHSSERTLAGALRDALLQVEGAFSLVLLAEDCVIVARDPHGFRPLAIGELELQGGGKAYVFASETVAFDLIGATYLHDVKPGEMVIVGPQGLVRERYAPEQQLAQCVFEHVYFARPDSIVFGRSVEESRENLGRLLARECPADADLVVPVPDSGVAAAIGYSDESGLPLPLRRFSSATTTWAVTFIGTLPGHPRFRSQALAEPGAASARVVSAWCWWTISLVRGNHQPQDRAHGAGEGKGRALEAHLPAHHRVRPAYRPAFYARGTDYHATDAWRTGCRKPHSSNHSPQQGGESGHLRRGVLLRPLTATIPPIGSRDLAAAAKACW